MELFKKSNNKLVSIPKKSFNIEKEIQTLVESNLKTIFNFEFVTSEFSVGEFRIDTVGFNEENKSFVIIEYKNGSSYSVIDQGYSYLSVMLERKSDFILEYKEKTKKELRKEEIDWTQSRVLFISPSFNTYQRNSVNFKDVPFELWEVQLFSDGIIGLEQYKSSSKESIEKFSSKNSSISKVTKQVMVLDETYHTSKCNELCLKLWEHLKNIFFEFSDTDINVRKNYISITKNKTAVCFVHFRKTSLLIVILLGFQKPNESKSSCILSLDDPTKIGKEKVVTTDKKGIKTWECHINVSSMKDLEYGILLVKQKYNQI